MRIKRLELVGFKSFPDRVVLEIPPGVTGIVGPNGCGKSNIVDAIRWALGEQNPRHLRGGAMEDVIFNGNEDLPPLGMAEVSITFENREPQRELTELDRELASLPAHIRELPEIEITRRYYRSGDSEYFINRTPCRLKDITELFLGTGVGTRAYGIIEQGRIEQLINARPEERRLFIEEAAGTTLYRSRKLAAERKMERTRENLARVTDILNELGRQIASLERQARKAERYRQLRQELRELELLLSGDQWRRLTEEGRRLAERAESLAAEEEQARRALAAAEEERRRAAESAAAAVARQAELREACAVLQSEQESTRERIRFLEAEIAGRNRRAERIEEALRSTAEAIARLREEAVAAEQHRADAASEVTAAEEAAAKADAVARSAREQVERARSETDQARSRLAAHAAQLAQQRTALAALDTRREDLLRRRERLIQEQRQQAERLGELECKAQEFRQSLENLRTRLSSLAGEKEQRAEQVRVLAETQRRWQREAVEIEAALVQARSRLESLEQIQADYEGFSPAVRTIMREERRVEGVLSVVAEVMEIPPDYERAVAAVLGDRLQYMIVEGEEHAAVAVDALRREAGGRGSFIPRRPRKIMPGPGAGALNGSSQPLLDLVRVPEQYREVAETLLGDVVLVPDLREAISIWRSNGVHVTLVTPEGDVVDPTGVVTGGSEVSAAESILARRREIETLRTTVAELQARADRARELVERAEETVREQQRALEAADHDLHQLTLQVVATEKDLERVEQEVPRCVSRGQVLRYEVTAIDEERGALEAEAKGLQERIQELEGREEELRGDLERCEAATRAATEHIEALQAEATARRVALAELRERQHAAAAAAEALQRRIDELAERQRSLHEENELARSERLGLEQSLAAARQAQAEQVVRAEELQRAVAAAATDADEASRRLQEIEQALEQVRERVDRARSERAQLDVQRSEIRVRLEHLEASMREKYEADLGQWVATVEDWTLPEDAAERVEELRSKLSRMGEVNVAAVDELRELEERAGYLRGQRDDLERSLADLERTIQKLNRVSRARFAETFARANETFQRVFPRLFRGGEARLVLTDEHNLLESGVDIVVRPPGKKIEGVALLSGGEKALVAVSLVFSLFLIRPAPFCILDEVDAPLDDANIGRYSQLVREMAEHSQFLLITHNKRTMEAADVLYGVTMQRPGVSKIVSVDIR